MDYCLEIWGAAAQTHLNVLLKAQKRVVRIIKSVPFRTHTEPLFRELKILTIEKIYIYKLLSFMYRYNYGLLPSTFDFMFIRNDNFHNYGTRQNMNLHIPLMRLNVTCRTLRYMGVKVWNYFKNIVITNVSLPCFKKHIRRYLLLNDVTNIL